MSDHINASEQELTISRLKAADVTELDWTHDIITAIKDGYARGYIQANLNRLHECTCGEDLRDELIDVCERDIWGK